MYDEVDSDDIQQCAERALAAWDLRATALRFVAARENAVFRVDCADGRSFALRIHRPGYHSLAELESEIEWTRALCDAGINVPQPLFTRAGTPYATVPFGAAGDTRQVGLVEWIEGTPLDEVLRTADPAPIYRELGALMARMHNQAAQWSPSAGFVRHSLDANGLIGDAPWWGPFWDLPEMSPEQSAVITAARHRMYRALVEYGTERESYSIIHADLLPQNVLMLQGAPVVIDFDDAGYGWHQYDMTVATVAFVGTDQLEPCRASMLDGYRSERAFSDDDAALLPMFMTIRQLVELGWLHTRVAEFVPVSADRTISRRELMEPRIERAVEGCRQVLDV